MTEKKKLLAGLATGLMTLGSIALASSAWATINVGTYNFDDNAFVDQLVSSSGGWAYTGLSLEQSFVGTDLNTYAGNYGTPGSATLAFTDNYLVNGPGFDLVAFESSGISYYGCYLLLL